MGGCTESEPSVITTEESAPGLVAPPVVTSPSPSQLQVTWEVPGLPNGWCLLIVYVPVTLGQNFLQHVKWLCMLFLLSYNHK